jgi:serine/threonine protein kinase
MDRVQKYDKINTKLSYLSDKEILQLIKKKEDVAKSSYGENTTIKIYNTKIFVKSIILTELEYNNKYNTSNLFNLPLYYNYGIGSYGINCWRELLIHIKTTNYVLSGECINFPLLYHYRIIETKPKHIKFDNFKYWNSNQNIKKYIAAKSKSKYRILLFIEWFPKVVHTWLLENKTNLNSFYEQAFKLLHFLQSNNIIHFDTHGSNIVVDSNNIIYLTDYGLVLDTDFILSKKELLFYNKNKYYDYGLLSLVIIWYLIDIVSDTKNKKFYEDKLNIIFTKNTNYTVIENIILVNYNFIFNNEKIKKPNKLSVLMEIANIYILILCD